MATMSSSRAKYSVALLLMLALITAGILASNITETIITFTSPAPEQQSNQTAPIQAPVFPEVLQPAKSVKVEVSELKSTYKPPKPSIKVGMVLYGRPDNMLRAMRNSLNQWAEEVNQNGGIFLSYYQKKIPIQIIIYEDPDSQNLGKFYHETLALQDKIDVAIVAGIPASASRAIAVLEENKIFHAVISNIEKNAIPPDNNYTVLLGGGTPENVGADFGRFAKSLGVKSVAIVRTRDSYYGNVSTTIKQSLDIEGIPVVIDDFNSLERLFFQDGIQNIRQKRPDAVLLLAPPSIELPFLATLRENLIGIPLVFTDLAIQSPGRMTTTLGRNADGLVGYSPWVPSSEFSRSNVNLGPTNAELIRISATHGNSPQAAHVYTAAKILQKIIEDSGSVDAKDMRAVALKLHGSMTALGPFFVGSDGAKYSNAQIIAQVHRANDSSISYEVMWPPEYKTSGVIYPIPNRFSRP